MGPSQFIPTTWAGYEDRIAKAVGVSMANPWDPEHAIMATAIYMQDLGAAGGGYTAERTAALKYYAGGNWNLPQNAPQRANHSAPSVSWSGHCCMPCTKLS